MTTLQAVAGRQVEVPTPTRLVELVEVGEAPGLPRPDEEVETGMRDGLAETLTRVDEIDEVLGEEHRSVPLPRGRTSCCTVLEHLEVAPDV